MRTHWVRFRTGREQLTFSIAIDANCMQHTFTIDLAIKD